MDFKLKVGEVIADGGTTITILDEVAFCYRVLSERYGKRGVRLISKSILEEFVLFLKTILIPQLQVPDRLYLESR